MLGIKIKERFLNLFPSTALTFEWSHPVGIITSAADFIQGGFSFPIDIPLEGNEEIIGYVSRLDYEGSVLQDEYCEVWIEGVPLFFGKASVQRSSNKRLQLFMIFNEATSMKGKALFDIDLGGDRMIGADTATRIAHANDTVANPLDHDYIFCPVLNPVYMVNSLGAGAVNSHLQNFWDKDGNTFVEELVGVAMPFIRLDYLLKQIFKAEGYTLDNQWQTTDELKLILLYNNFNIYIDNNTWSDVINLVNHVPIKNSLDVLKAVIGTYGLYLDLDPVKKKAYLVPWKTLIQASVYEDITGITEKDYDGETTKDFINRLEYDLDPDDELSVMFSGQDYQAPVLGSGLTARSLWADGDFSWRYAIADNSYYAIDPTPFKAIHLGQDHKDIIRGDGLKPYTSALIPMWNSWNVKTDGFIDDTIAFQHWMLPHIRHQGYVLYHDGLKKPQLSMRTMIYRGMQPFDVGIDGTYPMASTTPYDIRGNIIGDHSLLWDGDYGIYKTWWQPILEMLLNKKTVTRSINFSIRHLLNFKFSQKYRIENQNYFFAKLRFTATSRGLSKVEGTLIKTL